MKKVLFILVVMFLMISCGGEDARKIKMIPDEISDEDIVENVVDSQVDEVEIQDEESKSDSEITDGDVPDESPDEEDEYDEKYFDPDYEPDCGNNKIDLGETFVVNELNCDDLKDFTDFGTTIIKLSKIDLLSCLQNMKCVANLEISVDEYDGNVDLSNIESISRLNVVIKNSEIKQFKHPKRTTISYISSDDVSFISNTIHGYVSYTIAWNFCSRSNIVINNIVNITDLSIDNSFSNIIVPDLVNIDGRLIVSGAKNVSFPSLLNVNKNPNSSQIKISNFEMLNIPNLQNATYLSINNTISQNLDLYTLQHVDRLEIINNINLDFIQISSSFNAGVITIQNNPKLDAHYIFDKACMDADCTMEGNLGD